MYTSFGTVQDKIVCHEFNVSGKSAVLGSYKHGNTLLCSVKGREFHG
jgi:hypothetical protein